LIPIACQQEMMPPLFRSGIFLFISFTFADILNIMNPLLILINILKPLLYPISLLYGVIVWLRNKLYDAGLVSSIQFSVPVISVGNLSTGGTGKTPHIEYLIRLLQYEYKVATMSRGYKRRTTGFYLAKEGTDATMIGDEPMQFHQKFPDVCVSVCEDRMTGIPRLLGEQSDIDIVLLDDAFQHRSVKPGLNILIVDFAKPFYKDYILPFGSLREGRKAYKRADIIIVSKCPPQLSDALQQEMIEKIKPLPHQKVYFSYIAYDVMTDFFTGEPFIQKSKANIVMVSGIAKPEPMLEHLRSIAADVHLLRYPDHHYFTVANLEEIKQTITNWDVSEKIIVTTEKDAARLAIHKEELAQWNVRIAVLPIMIKFTGNEASFNHEVNSYIFREKEEMNME
jgi:tetraacyldisaccharide 4'-kinase